MHKYLVRVLVALLHARFSVVGPIPFLLAAIFFPGHPYIGSTTVLPDKYLVRVLVVLLHAALLVLYFSIGCHFFSTYRKYYRTSR